MPTAAGLHAGVSLALFCFGVETDVHGEEQASSQGAGFPSILRLSPGGAGEAASKKNMSSSGRHLE